MALLNNHIRSEKIEVSQLEGIVKSTDVTNIVVIAQEDYDDLSTKDPNTLYIVTE